MKNLIQNLDWPNDPQHRAEAIARILAHRDQIDLTELNRMGDKADWDDQAFILKTLGYPAIHPALPELLEWFQDVNWPGTELIVETMADVPLDALIPALEQAGMRALADQDGHWLYGLGYLVSTLRIDLNRIGEPLRSKLRK